ALTTLAGMVRPRKIDIAMLLSVRAAPCHAVGSRPFAGGAGVSTVSRLGQRLPFRPPPSDTNDSTGGETPSLRWRPPLLRPQDYVPSCRIDTLRVPARQAPPAAVPAARIIGREISVRLNHHESL